MTAFVIYLLGGVIAANNVDKPAKPFAFVLWPLASFVLLLDGILKKFGVN